MVEKPESHAGQDDHRAKLWINRPNMYKGHNVADCLQEQGDGPWNWSPEPWKDKRTSLGLDRDIANGPWYLVCPIISIPPTELSNPGKTPGGQERLNWEALSISIGHFPSLNCSPTQFPWSGESLSSVPHSWIQPTMHPDVQGKYLHLCRTWRVFFPWHYSLDNTLEQLVTLSLHCIRYYK
jgi:hypothetical protein